MLEDYLKENNGMIPPESQKQEAITAGENQFFYYVVDSKGQLILGNEISPRLRPDLLNLIQGWVPAHKEIRHERLRAARPAWERHDKNKKMGGKESFQPSEDIEIDLIMTGCPIFYRDQLIGTLYIGKDISFLYQLLRWLLVILVGLAVLFFGVALFIGYLMSKRAMVPIIQAFTRQREFVADASHELRTPLSVMLSSINAMEMTESIEADDFSRKLLSNMKDEVKRMTKLVSDLLTLARSDSGTIEILHETFDFRPHAEKVIQAVQPLAASKQINLHLHVPETLVIHGDSEKLTQLLYILLDNAIKYTPNGGEVHLSLSVEASEHRSMLCVVVQDTGIGIKPEDYDRIFDRFYRADKSRSRQMGGHGLGLAIAKWIVEAHQGTIHVSSELGKGSTFTIRIPFSVTQKRRCKVSDENLASG
ncbi:sensor histidine kinase [Thermoflavimicrobium dichotomicum]|uniref:histidine kinase n=1 Tax=Thermoflavimicrobium dichotomicum TaxID=46223 RepID=A0A1I3JN75_9BACL|nr:ATP-binding protein [Thermoflavimicrobium dichotomicum]SFI61626.1 His Kinase A (phospho-acceptor) domain-containing protein [Thermoflavimicrobium dichotomicum]